MTRSHLVSLLVGAAALAILLFFLIYLSGDPTLRAELLKDAGQALLDLALVGVIGASAKFLLDDYAARQQHQRELLERERTTREALHKARVDALNAITTSYFEIKKSLHIIAAHRSAKSYGEQVRQIIDYRLVLQRLDNEIVSGMYELKDSKAIGDALWEMDARLDDLIEEWKNEYLRLVQLQKRDEATSNPQEKRVPGEIDALPVFNQLRADRFKALHEPFEHAVTPIRLQVMQEKQGPQT